MRKTIPMVLALCFGAQMAQAYSAWYTCIPTRCSQKQVQFKTLKECADYQNYANSQLRRGEEKWKTCEPRP